MSVLVQRVVGELEFEEGHRLLHPVAPGGRRVRVDIRPAGRLGLGFSRHLPFLFIPLQEGDKTRQEVESAVRPTGSSSPPRPPQQERVCWTAPPAEVGADPSRR